MSTPLTMLSPLTLFKLFKQLWNKKAVLTVHILWLYRLRASEKKGMGNGMGDTKIDPANREKRNLEHQHPAIECFSAVWTSCAIKEN